MRFAESVVLMFEHDEDGSMGIIINRRIRGLNVAALLNQLEVPFEAEKFKHPAYFGGPVSSQSGFVVHTPDYRHESMVFLQDKAGCTSSVSILHALAAGKGPADYLVCLGQAKWVSGQLENELRQNVWLTLPFDTDIVFKCPDEKKMDRSSDTPGSPTRDALFTTRNGMRPRLRKSRKKKEASGTA